MLFRFFIVLLLLLSCSTFSYTQSTEDNPRGLRLWGHLGNVSAEYLDLDHDNSHFPLGRFALGYGWQGLKGNRRYLHDFTLQRLAIKTYETEFSNIHTFDVQLSYDYNQQFEGQDWFSLWWGLGSFVAYAQSYRDIKPAFPFRIDRESRQLGGGFSGIVRLRARLSARIALDAKIFPLEAYLIRTTIYLDKPNLPESQRTAITSDFNLTFLSRGLLGLSYQF
ncbi:MAG: hypothetical protein D6772_05750 [Bacteroidetes bacterium]|nr:MAG: hypothetical protein D6772_05750 [Bacteroidota bacterium]